MQTKYDYLLSRTKYEIPQDERKIAAYLTILPGGDVQTEHRFSLYTGTTILGSSSEVSDIYIKGTGEHFVEDLDSTNGTFIGDYRIHSRRMYQITDGKQLTFGPTKCIYHMVTKEERERSPTPELESLHQEDKTSKSVVEPVQMDALESESTMLLEGDDDIMGENKANEDINVLLENVNDMKAVQAEKDVPDSVVNRAPEITSVVVESVLTEPLKEKRNVSFDLSDTEDEFQPKPVKKAPAKRKPVTKKTTKGKSVVVKKMSIYEPEKEKVSPTLAIAKEDVDDLTEPVVVAGPYEHKSEPEPVLEEKKTKKGARGRKTKDVEDAPVTKRTRRASGSGEMEFTEPAVILGNHSDSMTQLDHKGEPVVEEKKPKKGAKGRKTKEADDTPVTKRTRRTSGSTVLSNPKQPTEQVSVRILFTGIPDSDSRKKICTQLGGLEVTDWKKCTHLVTDRVRRTVKFLCCVSAGKHILDISWLENSKALGYFAPEDEFVLKDLEAEKQYTMNLKDSLTNARENIDSRLFTGLSIFNTLSVKPTFTEMKEIVEAAGAKILKDTPTRKLEGVIVIADKNDTEEMDLLGNLGYTIYSKEFLFTGILTQQLDFENHQI